LIFGGDKKEKEAKAMFNKTLIIIFALTVITLALQTNTAKSQIVTDGLVSYWTFDSADIKGTTVKDVFGDNDGTIIGPSVSDYPDVSAGDWHHYGYVKSGTTLTLYLDGDLVVSDACPEKPLRRFTAFSATHSLVGTELAFGSYRIQNAKDGLYIYNGLIDETRIYDRALRACVRSINLSCYKRS